MRFASWALSIFASSAVATTSAGEPASRFWTSVEDPAKLKSMEMFGCSAPNCSEISSKAFCREAAAKTFRVISASAAGAD